MKRRSLSDRVLVLSFEGKEKTASGLIIPHSADETPQEGKIASVGPGKWDENGKWIPLEVKKGDHVLYSSANTRPIKSRSMVLNIS